MGCWNCAEGIRSGKIKEWKDSNLGDDIASEMKMEEGPIVSGICDSFPLSCNDR